ncbi:MAG: hypothetical protein ABIS06_20315 [Vicinamibacterales bacterium]
MFKLVAALLLALLGGAAATAPPQDPAPARAGEALPARTTGTLDIHQIATGRGNAAFMRFPDGSYWVIVLDDTTEARRVRSVHGPYASE